MPSMNGAIDSKKMNLRACTQYMMAQLACVHAGVPDKEHKTVECEIVPITPAMHRRTDAGAGALAHEQANKWNTAHAGRGEQAHSHTNA